MARQVSRREITLLAGLALVCVIGWVYWPGGSGPAGGRGDDSAEGMVRLAGQAPRVRMDLLERAADAYDPSGRNLFAYGKPPRRPEDLERQRRLEELRRKREEEARKKRERPPARRAPVPTRTAQPSAPNIPYKVLGVFGPKDRKIVVFQDGDELLLGRQGDVLEEKFKVVEIRYETVVMGYTEPRFAEHTRELTMAKRKAKGS